MSAERISGGRRRFLKDRRGSIFVETAILMPVLLTILLGGLEVGRFALLQQKLSRTATSMSDMVAVTKTTLSLTQLDNLYDAVSYVMAPFDMGTEGVLIVTAVTRNATTPIVSWQCTGAGSLAETSAIGTAGGTATMPAGFTMVEGEVAIIAEVMYQYRPFVAPDMFGTTILRQSAMFRPRTGALGALVPGAVQGSAPTCLPTP